MKIQDYIIEYDRVITQIQQVMGISTLEAMSILDSVIQLPMPAFRVTIRGTKYVAYKKESGGHSLIRSDLFDFISKLPKTWER